MSPTIKFLIVIVIVTFVAGAGLFVGGTDNGYSSSPNEKTIEKSNGEKAENEVEASGLNWFTYESGMEKIKSENKAGLIYFYTDWCKYCRMMDSQTFSDPSIKGYLNDHVVPIRINAEEQTELAKKYNAYQFPLNLFVSKTGEIISQQPGYIPPEMLIQMLEFIDSESYKSMEFKEFMERRN